MLLNANNLPVLLTLHLEANGIWDKFSPDFDPKLKTAMNRKEHKQINDLSHTKMKFSLIRVLSTGVFPTVTITIFPHYKPGGG